MKLEVGKKYISRSGKIYTITTYNGHTYGHSCCAAMWYLGGYCLSSTEPHEDDLIEEVKEPNMEFLIDKGVSSIGEVGPLKVGDRVTFSDGSYSCYPTKGALRTIIQLWLADRKLELSLLQGVASRLSIYRFHTAMRSSIMIQLCGQIAARLISPVSFF